MLQETIILCLLGAVGSILENLLAYIEQANLQKSQRPSRDLSYYFANYILKPLIGAFVVYLYVSSGSKISNLVAVNIGISAPMILKSLIIRKKSPPSTRRIG